MFVLHLPRLVSPFDNVKLGWFDQLLLTNISYSVHHNLAANPKRNYSFAYYALRPKRKKTRERCCASFLFFTVLLILHSPPSQLSATSTQLSTHDLHSIAGMQLSSSPFFFFDVYAIQFFSDVWNQMISIWNTDLWLWNQTMCI